MPLAVLSTISNDPPEKMSQGCTCLYKESSLADAKCRFNANAEDLRLFL